MNVEPDKVLNRLVVVGLTVFLIMIALLAALVVRQHWLQQRVVALSEDVQFNLENLEETTEEIQRELSQIRSTPGQVQMSDSWDDISETLEGVDQQLDSLGEDLGDVAQALEPQAEIALAPGTEAPELEAVYDPVDQVFTIFAVLVAITSIIVAILLAVAVRVQETGANQTGS